MAIRRGLGVFVTVLTLCATAIGLSAQNSSNRSATPVDPIDAILKAFESYSIVALGEGPHGNEQGLAFRLRLIRDRRFAATVNDIVVESGSAGYQDVVDRYMQGEDVPTNTMRDVFENTVTPTPVWDRPMYAEFFRAVRAMNRVLPRERQVRVLLGDPAIDWNTVKTRDDYLTLLRQRDSHPADLIRREVLAKNRHALVIYGDGHFQAKTERPALSMAALLEAAGARVFTITTTFADLPSFQPDVTSWRIPAFCAVARHAPRRRAIRALLRSATTRAILSSQSSHRRSLRRPRLSRPRVVDDDGPVAVSEMRRTCIRRDARHADGPVGNARKRGRSAE